MKKIIKLFTFGILTFTLFGISNVLAMQIFINFPTGEKVTLNVESGNTIEQVKDKIKDEKNISIIQQKLYYNNRQLEDGRTLADYNVQKEANLQIIVKKKIIINDIDNGVITADKNVALNEEIITLTVTPSDEYKLKNISGITTTKVNDTTYTFVMPDKDVNISAEFEKIHYEVTNGGKQIHTIGTNENAVFTIDADHNSFDKIYLNEEKLNSEFYTITEENTTLTLKQGFLNNLLPGTYNLKTTFSNGKEANTTFVIVKPINNPKTDDSILDSMIVGSISLIGLLGASIYLRKQDLINN